MFVAIKVACSVNKSFGNLTPYYMVLDTSDGSQEFYSEFELLKIVGKLKLREVKVPENSSDCFLCCTTAYLLSNLSIEIGKLLCSNLDFKPDSGFNNDTIQFYKLVGSLFQIPAYIKNKTVRDDDILKIRQELLQKLETSKNVKNVYLKNVKTSKSSADRCFDFDDENIEFYRSLDDTPFYIF